MTNLSPAAQAVWNAYLDNSEWDASQCELDAIAAALRAAADRRIELEVLFSVVDEWEKIKGSCASFYAAAEWGYKQALKEQRAIAAELEAHD